VKLLCGFHCGAPGECVIGRPVRLTWPDSGRWGRASSERLMRGVQTRILLLTVASLALAVAGVGMAVSDAAADTLEWALVQAYQNNPSLNAQRAALRATDENVPQALSGYRPKVIVTARV